MSDYIVRHAVKNAWCSPEQDYQHIFQPAKISRPRGERSSLTVEWETIKLPDPTSTFHVYQIGQLSPKYLNLASESNTWYSALSVCNERNLLVDFYFNNGRQLPRAEVFFYKTRTRNLIIAIKEQVRNEDLRTEPVFVRFYTNAYFTSERSWEDEEGIYVYSRRPETRSQVVLFQRKIRDLQEKKGYVYIFHNGWLVENTHPDIVKPGDSIELIHDTSIKEVVDFPIEELETFSSQRDGVKKYLLSRLKKTTDTIDYQDDIDLWLWQRNPDHYDRVEGIYFHKNQAMAQRMLTHKDYSVPVSHVVGFANEFEHWKNPQKLTLRLHIRHSGYRRDLVDVHTRIKELYRLDDDQILRAMVGADSTVSVWEAAALENSAYSHLMGAYNSELNRELVQNAYGYNAVSKIIGDSPQRVSVHKRDLGIDGVHLPVGLREESTLFEYNSEGRLLNYVQHDSGKFYDPHHADCELVEGIPGIGSSSLDTVYGESKTELADHYDFQCYYCESIGGIPTYDWKVAVLDTHYQMQGNKIEWLLNPQEYYTAVRTDQRFLNYPLALTPNNGVLRFSITAEETEFGETLRQPLRLPVGRLDLYLNGRALIENVDYFVNWPEVVVVNKNYLIPNSATQYLHVRGTGFCGVGLERQLPDEVGFVSHGLLSRNEKFDVRNDKVMRFVVNGGIHHRDELMFIEDDHGYSMQHIANGAPYALEDVVVPMRNFVPKDTFTYREESLKVDKEISDYLTEFHPEKPIAYPSTIERRYPLISPFTSRIHHDLQRGFLYPEGIEGQYGDQKIKEWLKDYEWLLDFDPVIMGYDEDYVSIHPHEGLWVTELDVYQYTFLKRAVELYLKGKVDLTSFVKIKDGWV